MADFDISVNNEYKYLLGEFTKKYLFGKRLWCLGDLSPRPQIGIVRSVHRPYLCHAYNGEITPTFSFGTSALGTPRSQALTRVEQTVELPATGQRSLFGSPVEDK